MGETLRILVATDNHLGVCERDPIRGDDSFQTFEEIFKIARERQVDFVLLGGDLFHENKPSRNTVVKSMDILSRHCLGDDEIGFEILSDQTHLFTTGRVNYENPNLNIGLPVFTIHGNHDDPSSADDTSAVDILASANLVNYFGKAKITRSDINASGEVKIRPILIRKGNTKLALYGLGNIRDERMCRLFSSPHGVEWARPASSRIADVDDWVNIFILHQNRVAHVQGAKNIVKETHLPKFLDVVVWGHEHECISQPWSSSMSGGAFSVLQPGSSVATALSDGESKKKHVFVLEIREKKWRTIKIPLETVRPFIFDSVTLSNQPSVNPGNPGTVEDFLTKKVEEMIDRANRERESASPELPLIRLRVDYSGFSTINTQVFAHQFVNKVANPQDLILWQKPPRKIVRKAVTREEITEITIGEKTIEQLIEKNLREELKILPEIELAHALNEYVQKDEKSALVDTVRTVLAETKQDAERDTRGKTSDTIESEEERMRLIACAIASAAGRRKNKVEAEHIVQLAQEKLNSIDAASKQRHEVTDDHQVDNDVSDVMHGDDGPETIDLSCEPGDLVQQPTRKRRRATGTSKASGSSPPDRQKVSKTATKSKGTWSEQTTQGGTRISTRARALAGLRASAKNGTTQATESKWASLKK